MNLRMTKWILLVTFLFSCSQQGQAPGSSSKSSENLGTLSVNINKYAANKIVCDPLGGGETQATKSYVNGIKAELFYRGLGMPRWYTAQEYVDKGFKSEQNLFLNDINVPTRMFQSGFLTNLGQVLNDDQNNKLIEYFGLKMKTNIVLNDEDEEGFYEFALLSDDGSVLKIVDGGLQTPPTVLINNDGDHPTKMGCSNNVIRMRKATMLPVELTYYQGPRYHISNILMFRKSSQAGQDTSCGRYGNELFFNPTNQAPQQPFLDLKNRGWKVLKPSNYKIAIETTDTANTEYNPCSTGSAPIISNFQLGEIFLTDASFSWATDLPATSQIILTEVATGAVTITTSDNILRKQHAIMVNNLKPSTQYKAQALSVSADLGRATSSEVFFSTP